MPLGSCRTTKRRSQGTAWRPNPAFDVLAHEQTMLLGGGGVYKYVPRSHTRTAAVFLASPSVSSCAFSWNRLKLTLTRCVRLVRLGAYIRPSTKHWWSRFFPISTDRRAVALCRRLLVYLPSRSVRPPPPDRYTELLRRTPARDKKFRTSFSGQALGGPAGRAKLSKKL